MVLLQWKTRHARTTALLALLSLVCLLAQLGDGLAWIGRTWTDPTYGSAGLLPLLLLAPALLRLPPARREPSGRHLAGLVVVALIDLLVLQRLSINVLRAGAAVLALHLWLVAFREYRGRWYSHLQLWLGLACLPVVHWGNTLFGYPLQQLAARIAGGAVSLYGLPVAIEGTQLRVADLTIAVDSTCSGLKLLYCGALFGLLASAGRRLPAARLASFWAALLGLTFAANVLRVLCLTLTHVHTGSPPGDTLHQAIGLVAFVIVAALPSLWLLRRLMRHAPVPNKQAPPEEGAAEGSERTNGRQLWPRLAVLALSLTAVVSCATPSQRRVVLAGHAAPRLPATLDGEPSRPLPLGPSEKLLARSPRVSLERRAYGSTQVALIHVRRGIKELHPPSVCLKAAGYEVVSQQQLALGDGGCLQQLKVRDAQRRSFHFLAGYIADGGDVDCSYAAQAGRAIWQRLTGRRTATAALQVMDTELTRARQVAIALLGRIARSAQPARTKQEATKR